MTKSAAANAGNTAGIAISSGLRHRPSGIRFPNSEKVAAADAYPAYSDERYLYTHVMNGGPARLLGAAHGLELYYVFQTMGRLHAAYSPTADDLHLESEALGYWTPFAAKGEPKWQWAAPVAEIRRGVRRLPDTGLGAETSRQLGRGEMQLWDAIADLDEGTDAAFARVYGAFASVEVPNL